MTLADGATVAAPGIGRGRRSTGKVLVWAVLLTAAAVILVLPLLPIPDPNEQSLSDALAGPSAGHLLGTDQLGRDSLARLLYGMRTSFASAFLALAIAAGVGLPLGLISGYRGGTLDAVLARIADAIMSIPPLILLLAVITALGQGITKSMIILGLILSPRLFRVVRASTIALSTSEFLSVGRMSGCRTPRILARYILPNIREQVIVQLTILLGYGVLTEASISFLGLGVQPPNPSLGVLLRSSIDYLDQAPLLTLAPGIVISAFILGCNLAGDAYAIRKDNR